MSYVARTRVLGRRTFLKGVAAGAVGIGLGQVLGPEGRAEEEGAGAAEIVPVRRRVLGRTGREVSAIVFGGGGLSPAPERTDLLRAAYDHGIDFIDVAWGYGNGRAEEGVGAFLSTFPHREKLFISTKTSGIKLPQGSSREVYEAFKAQLAVSLERLKCGYVDLLMWPHGATSPEQTKNEAVRDALRKLKEEKLVRHFGVSTHSNYGQTALAAAEDGFYDVVLTVVNICTQNPDKAGEIEAGRRQRGRPAEDTRPFLAAAKKNDVGVLAMKVANQGFLGKQTDALLAETYPEPTAWSRHQMLYAYGLAQEGVSAVLVGIHNVMHLREAVAIGAT